jgi:acyl-coenzyme A thioesterase PaaI-like protein
MTSRSVSSRHSAQEIAESVQFEPEFISGLREIFETRVAFNQTIGLKIGEITPTLVQGHIAMRPDLIGHSAYQRIHGGVISAGLDSMGGLAVMAAIAAKHMDDTPAQRLHRFPGWAQSICVWTTCAPASAEFLLTARVLRLGSRVANTQMEFLSVDGELLSTGTVHYIVLDDL